MKFSIIIINYRTFRLTSECVASLLSLPGQERLEIIVVDNGSGDDSVEKLKNKFKSRIKIIANAENLGFAGANNEGARTAQGEYLLFLNSDTVVKNDIFTALAKHLSEAKTGAVSPRLLLDDGSPQKSAFGLFPTLFGLILQKGKKELNNTVRDNKMVVDWISGCALAIRKELFVKIGGWDDKFFLYFEDIDICRRIKKAGYNCAVCWDAEIIHLGGRSLSLNQERKKYYYRSQDYYFAKHYGIAYELAVKTLRWAWQLIKKY